MLSLDVNNYSMEYFHKRHVLQASVLVQSGHKLLYSSEYMTLPQERKELIIFVNSYKTVTLVIC